MLFNHKGGSSSDRKVSKAHFCPFHKADRKQPNLNKPNQETPQL